ncbi:MAG: hypothetical protein ACR2QT_07335 [Woeseiaceae bacterium]
MNLEAKAERWFFLAWVLISAWILACAVLVKGEYGDGYQTMVNGRYFYADAVNYYMQRGPLAAFAMGPVELFRGIFHWSAIDVRPYHVYSGLLHSLYLLGCWMLLKRAGDDRVAQFAAFGAAILSVVFYANAPHLSHDIIPGLLFLLLIFLCNRWINAPTRMLALQLILLGTAVTFIKQTYALFWAALVFYAFVAYILKWNDARVSGRKAFTLLGLAGISAVISWFGYGIYIVPELPGSTVLTGPLDLMKVVSVQYGKDFDAIFTTDIYLRNIHNFGIAAMLLVLPGLVLAFRGKDARLRMIAVCWVVSVIALQLTSFREVRYLAFLAPLTAMLIIPTIRLVINHRAAAAILLLVILFDQYRGLTVSAAQLSSTGGTDIDRFIGAPSGDGKIIFSRNLSFVFMPASPMRRDPYHGIYHISAALYRRLNENELGVIELRDPRDLGYMGVEPTDRVYYSNINVLRKTPWRADNVPASLEMLVMVAGDAEIVTLRRQGDEYVVDGADGQFYLLVPGPDAGREMPLLSSISFRQDLIERLYGERGRQDELTVIGIAVKALCQAEKCLYE